MFLTKTTTTLERLAIETLPANDGSTTVREIGHFGYIIYEYKIRPVDPARPLSWYTVEHDIDFLVHCVADLEQRCATAGRDQVIQIELAQWRWNLRAAKRRLRRLVKEKDAQFLEIPVEHHGLVQRIIKEGSEPPPFKFDPEILNELLWTEGAIDDFYDYERRKAERVILVLPKIPAELRALLGEANEAYFHGLFRAAIALCRAVLEDVLRRVIQAQCSEAGPIPINAERLDVLINCVPLDLLNPEDRKIAHLIRLQGNKALHNAEVHFSEDTTWLVLITTGRLVELLLRRAAQATGSFNA